MLTFLDSSSPAWTGGRFEFASLKNCLLFICTEQHFQNLTSSVIKHKRALGKNLRRPRNEKSSLFPKRTWSHEGFCFVVFLSYLGGTRWKIPKWCLEAVVRFSWMPFPEASGLGKLTKKLRLLREEYERYKDLWGLNIFTTATEWKRKFLFFFSWEKE